MTGLKLVLPTTFTDTSLPILWDDPILSAGSLVLVDPAHGANPWAAGVPAAASRVPNLAGVSAKTLLSTTVSTDVDPIFEMPTPFAANKGKVARSGKGGLDLVSTASVLTTNEGASFNFPDALKTYLLAHLDDDFFISSWLRLTRAGGTDGGTSKPTFHSISATSGATSNYLQISDTSSDLPGSGANLIGKRATSTNTVGPMLRNSGVANFTGTKPTTTATLRTRFAVVGRPLDTVNGGMSTTGLNFSPSYVFYRFYMENLTVSGRTYAEVDAIDNAEYTKQVLTAGGRYYGDTYTDPTTIP